MGLFDKLLTPDGKHWSGRRVFWLIDPATGKFEEAAPDPVSSGIPDQGAMQVRSANATDSNTASCFGVLEAARRLGCSTKTIHKLCGQGRLNFYWVGNKRRFCEEDVRGYRESQKHIDQMPIDTVNSKIRRTKGGEKEPNKERIQGSDAELVTLREVRDLCQQ